MRISRVARLAVTGAAVGGASYMAAGAQTAGAFTVSTGNQDGNYPNGSYFSGDYDGCYFAPNYPLGHDDYANYNGYDNWHYYGDGCVAVVTHNPAFYEFFKNAECFALRHHHHDGYQNYGYNNEESSNGQYNNENYADEPYWEYQGMPLYLCVFREPFPPSP